MHNIDLYYQSLKQVLDDLEAWEPPKPKAIQRLIDWLLGTAFALFVLSLIPVLPTVLILLRGVLPIQVLGLDTTSGSIGAFIPLWLAATVLTGVSSLLANWANDRIDKRFESPKGPSQTLSNDQAAFVKTYEAYKELKVYFVSHLDRHVENAYKAIRGQLGPARLLHPSLEYKLLDEEDIASIERIPRHPDDEVVVQAIVRGYPASFIRAARGSLGNQLSAAVRLLETFNKYDWFELDTQTDLALRALISLPSRILYRLRDQEELPQVLEVLEHLSKFLYAYLPEHATDKEQSELTTLRSQGQSELAEFVKSVDKLTEYRGKTATESKVLEGRHRIIQTARMFYSRFVFARFLVWFAVILAVTTAGVFVFNQVVPISSDTMATIVIGSSVAGAVGLAVFLPKQSESK